MPSMIYEIIYIKLHLINIPQRALSVYELVIVGSMEVPSKIFLLFFLFSDWLKSNHLRSRIERGFLDIFSHHICSAVTKTIRVTNYATSFGAKNVQKAKFEAAEMILDPWNQQVNAFQIYVYRVKQEPQA